MAKQKLPHATDWENRNIEDWTATTFRAYFAHHHDKKFGVPYSPFRSWAVEATMYKKAYTEYGKEVTKRFIAQEIEAYQPNDAYPATSFGFLFSYRKNVIQRIKLDYDKEVVRASQTTTTDLDTWEW